MMTSFQTFKSLQDWFGDRGEVIKRSWIKDWKVDGDSLYVQWSEKAPYEMSAEAPFDCSSFNWKSLYCETNDYQMFKDIQSGET